MSTTTPDDDVVDDGRPVTAGAPAADVLDESPPALLDDPAVSAAIATHRDTQVAVVEAKERLTRARDAVRDTLFAAGQRYRDRELPLPRHDLHRLYWDHRELRVTDVAKAFGIDGTELARLAGPRQGVGRCDDCHRAVPMLLESRTPRPTYGPPMRCDPCRDRHDAREERERRRQHELDLARVAAGDHVPAARLDGRYDGTAW